ncbi:protein fem-1-like protein [Plakobranchus ocellatus]|uniref:Protein fem-1-like protein n=1 Tax=Plakobranchus ocellatus TaxID=259542 RepID=A0AAV4AKD6_9GAST|nr:protein fem-1-like protein [Plakobranchus ocellatus]
MLQIPKINLELLAKVQELPSPSKGVCLRGDKNPWHLSGKLFLQLNSHAQDWFAVATSLSAGQIDVTPLWYASATGNLDLVRLLTSFGADVNATTETGSTAVRAACCTGHVAVVHFLVAHGADLRIRTLHGVTCLMSSVHSVPLTKFSLHHGVPINAADEQGNTALHYAAEAGHPEVTRLLVETGADASLVNKAGCSPLQGAAENRHQQVAEYLIQAISPKLMEIIDAYSILGAMTIIVSGDTRAGLSCWHKALTLTGINSTTSATSPGFAVPSLTTTSTSVSIHRPTTAVKRGTWSVSRRPRRCPTVLEKELCVKEVCTTKDLGLIASNFDALCTQALLMYERIRGESHDNLVSLIMYRGAMCADGGDFTQAARLWIVAYQIQLQKCREGQLDLLHPRICRNLKFLCRVLCQMGKRSKDDSPRSAKIEEERFTKLFHMACGHTLKCLKQPNKDQELDSNDSDIVLKSLLTFFYAYLLMFSSEERSVQFWQHLREIISANPKDSESKCLMMLSLEQQSVLTSRLDPEEPDSHTVFPWRCRQMLEILLLLGADPLVRDCRGDTILHAAVRGLREDSSSGASDPDTVLMLLKHGAHPDQVNHSAATPCDLLSASETGVRRILQNKITLQCLAARVVVAHHIPYVGEIPRALYMFVELHAP